MGNYDDIINLPRPELKNHKRSSRIARASQFGAFRALTGHEDAINETARFTEFQIDISENMIEILNGKLQIIREMIDEEPNVKITYFIPDEKKDGGKYTSVEGRVKKIDEFARKIILKDKTEIPTNMITDIDGPLFSGTY